MGMGKYNDGLPEKIIRFNKYIIYCFKQLYNFTILQFYKSVKLYIYT